MTDWPDIVREHGPLVWRTAFRLLNHEADAADCLQRAFVSALERSRAEPIHNWPGLLKHLATARAIECLRRRERDSNRMTAMPENPLPDAKALQPHQAAELAGHLRQALADLDVRQATVFALARLEGLTYQEISAQVGVTVNHVGVLLNRATSILRERLRAYAPASAGPRTKPENQP